MKNIKKKSALLTLLIVIGCFIAGALTTCIVMRCGLFQPHLASGSAVSAAATAVPSIQSKVAASSSPYSETSQPVLDSNGSAIDGAATSKTEKAKPVTVTDKISPDLQFPTGKKGTAGSWMLENIKSNTVIIQCGVYFNGRQIAKSVPIRPNQHIESITLSTGVAAGAYKATAIIQYFELETGEYISQASYTIHLTVR